MKVRRVVFCIVALSAVAASSAHADVITFSDRAAFQGALTSSQVIIFDNFPVGSVAACGGGPPAGPCIFPVGNVTFVGGQGDIQSQFGITDSFSSSPALILNTGSDSPDDFMALFSGNAFGVDISRGRGGVSNIALTRVTLTSGANSFSIDLVGNGFVGAISDTAFTSASFQWLPFGPNNSQTANFAIDNVTVGSAVFTATPEPATLLLLGFGAAAVTRMRRRRPV